MRETDCEAVVIIANPGYSDIIIEAARKKGASGGTVIHANGEDTKQEEQLSGVTITAEKEMILIVTESQRRDEIIKAIMDNAGAESGAQPTVFSLPVASTDGLHLQEEEKQVQ